MKRKLYDTKEFENVRDVLFDCFEKYSDHIAFTVKTKEEGNTIYTDITYEQLKNDCVALGTQLINAGLINARIAIIGKNSYEWAVTYLTTMCGEGVVVPLDKGLPPQEIEDCLARSKADVIVFAEDYVDCMKDIKINGKTSVKNYICMQKVSGFPYLYDWIAKGKELFESGKTDFVDSITIDNDKMSFIIFTSGTTSKSKAVMLSHRNVASNIYGIRSSEKILDTDTNYCLLPFHHTFGGTGLLMMLSSGARNVFSDGLRHIADNLNEYQVSVLVCVPLLLEAMHKKIMRAIEKQGKLDTVEKGKKITGGLKKIHIDVRRKVFKDIISNLGALRLVVSGAAAIDKQVAEDFNAWGIDTIQGYGLTETSPVDCAENIKSIRYGSIGVPLCNVDMDIFEPNSEGIGEIIVKGPNVMLGYYNDEKATKEVIIDGWFHTGDLGYKDKDGYFFVSGRKKNVIVLKNGKNVYPEELEQLLNNLPYVNESMVFGYPEEDGDLLVSAKIQYNKDYLSKNFVNATQEELSKIIWEDIKHINSTLTTYKYIKKLVLTEDEMIKTTTAKVKRFEEIDKTIKQIGDNKNPVIILEKEQN